MKKLTIILITLFSIPSLYAQITMDVGNPNTIWGTTAVNVIDPATLGNKKVELINFSDIDGSPFYNQKWSKGFLYLKNGNLVKIEKMKLNMFTNEVDYLNINNIELVLEASNFKKILLMKEGDTSSVAGIFECFPDISDEKKNESFYKTLNTGKYQLFLLEKVLLKRGNYDPLIGKDQQTFYKKRIYAIKFNDSFTPLTILDKNHLLPLLNVSKEAEDWLEKSRNKLKNEKDIVEFFDYLNKIK